MTIPTLKRINIASEDALRIWLSKQPDTPQKVMVVSHAKGDTFINPSEMAQAAQDNGWTTGFRYTLNGGLVGQVMERV